MGLQATGGRQHYWDVTRAALMLLGIPYHVAMLYHPGGWIVNVTQESALLGGLAQTIHLFRMPAFFVVAGYFAGLLLEKREPGAWFKSRVVRLGIPLVTSLFVLVPLMNLFGEWSARPMPGAVAEWKYQAATSGGYWVRHLWFLIVTLYLSAMAAGVVALFPNLARGRIAAGLDAALARSLPLALLGIAVLVGLWEGAAIEGFYSAGLNTNLIQQILRVDDLIMFAPYFLLGLLLRRAPRALDAFGQVSPPVVITALAALVVGIATADKGWPPLGRFLGTIVAVLMTQVLVSLARTFLDRPNRTVERLVQGSFVIYLVHLPLLIALYDVTKLAGLPAALGFPLNLAATMALSWGAWRMVERVPALNLLFNGIVPAGPATAPKTIRAREPVSG